MNLFRVAIFLCTDDSTPSSLDEIIEKLDIDIFKICEFQHNGYKDNPGKFYSTHSKNARQKNL